MKKHIFIIALAIVMIAALTACGSDKEDPTDTSSNTPDETIAEETFTYDYEGAFGAETAQIVLKDGDVAEFNIPGNDMLVDVYAGTYVKEGDVVSIKGLKSKDSSSEYPIPGLWAWIDATTGDAEITVNADGTFTPTIPEGAESSLPAIDGDLPPLDDASSDAPAPANG
jgi:hypothetical protein